MDITVVDQFQDIRVAGNGFIGIQITGTFVATITFRASIDGENFADLNMLEADEEPAITSTTAPGIFRGIIGGYSVIMAIC